MISSVLCRLYKITHTEQTEQTIIFLQWTVFYSKRTLSKVFDCSSAVKELSSVHCKNLIDCAEGRLQKITEKMLEFFPSQGSHPSPRLGTPCLWEKK